MDAADHYKKAEELLASQVLDSLSDEEWYRVFNSLVAQAAVHASLAQVALEAETRISWALPTEEDREVRWRKVFLGPR